MKVSDQLQRLEKEGFTILSNADLKALMLEINRLSRKDDKTNTCSKSTAMEILGCKSDKTFYKIINKTRGVRGSVQGTYILSKIKAIRENN
ncbi:hypothetical protein ACJRPK_14120 [Aquimarina sp. 2-A2]|uniref:hypothetical protein n=1 Tax=Aquimarina sp. 2-A2 TaxID=3382644 RepID=UPI00387F0DB0